MVISVHSPAHIQMFVIYYQAVEGCKAICMIWEETVHLLTLHRKVEERVFLLKKKKKKKNNQESKTAFKNHHFPVRKNNHGYLSNINDSLSITPQARPSLFSRTCLLVVKLAFNSFQSNRIILLLCVTEMCDRLFGLQFQGPSYDPTSEHIFLIQ